MQEYGRCVWSLTASAPLWPALWTSDLKALSSRGRGRLRGFLGLRRPWGFSPVQMLSIQGQGRKGQLRETTGASVESLL